jgi:hypothetical protein
MKFLEIVNSVGRRKIVGKRERRRKAQGTRLMDKG